MIEEQAKMVKKLNSADKLKGNTFGAKGSRHSGSKVLAY